MLRSDPLRLAGPSVSQVFLNDQNGLRNGWWLAIFLGFLAVLLFGTILVSGQTGREISVWEQAGLIAVATAVVQLLRRKPITEVTGALNGRALRDGAVGLVAGFVLMAVPACLLWLSDIVRLDLASTDLRSCLTPPGRCSAWPSQRNCCSEASCSSGWLAAWACGLRNSSSAPSSYSRTCKTPA